MERGSEVNWLSVRMSHSTVGARASSAMRASLLDLKESM